MTIDNDYYLSVSQVTAGLGVSRASLYRWIAADAFPRGHHFSAGCRRWKLSDVLAWEMTREAQGILPPSKFRSNSSPGFANSNMISIIKSGSTKLALDRVPQLSKALDCDPAFLLRLALEQSLGATAAKSVHDIFGTPLTRNEIEWIAELRNASGDTDPRLTARSRAAFRGIFGK